MFLQSFLRFVNVFDNIDSTTSYLLNQKLITEYHVCLCESQSQGKGRFGRTWESPFGENIYFSLKTVLLKRYLEKIVFEIFFATQTNFMAKDIDVSSKLKFLE